MHYCVFSLIVLSSEGLDMINMYCAFAIGACCAQTIS